MVAPVGFRIQQWPKAASRFLESRRGRHPYGEKTEKQKQPPQDFWNRAVVAVRLDAHAAAAHARLKISGIAPWSPRDDLFVRAVNIAASRFLESRRGRPAILIL